MKSAFLSLFSQSHVIQKIIPPHLHKIIAVFFSPQVTGLLFYTRNLFTETYSYIVFSRIFLEI